MSFQDFQTLRLLALVGSNPLPAAVAGSLLSAEGGTVTLVCTKATRGVAEKLRTWLDHWGISCEDPLEIVEADRAETERRVLNWLGTDARSLGLNYTGGTKSMAVHVYDVLKTRAERERTRVPIFSYLDPRRLSMVFDPMPGRNINLVLPIPQDYPMRLKDLIEMHGWEETSIAKKAIDLPLTNALRDLYAGTFLAIKAWLDWKHRIFRDQCYNRSGHVKPLNAQKAADRLPARLPLPTDLLLGDLAASIRESLTKEGLSAVDGNELVFGAIKGVCGIGPEAFCEYLDGLWLESLVLRCLQGHSDDLGLHDMGRSLRVKLPTNTRVDFELDVVALHGYQLFAMSCGTSTGKKELKLKLFEAYTRARQIGGDEARVALVCPSEQPGVLQDELTSDIGDGGHLRVFGKTDLPLLDQRLPQWIAEQSQAKGAG